MQVKRHDFGEVMHVDYSRETRKVLQPKTRYSQFHAKSYAIYIHLCGKLIRLVVK